MGSIAKELKAARRFLKKGDLARVAHHLAGVAAEDPTSEALGELLGAFRAAGGPACLDHLPVGDGVFHGTAALRARVLWELGRCDEAVSLLFHVIAAVPSVPYARWLESWAASGAGLDGVDPEALATRAQELLDAIGGAAAEQGGAAAGSVVSFLRAAAARHPASPLLFFVACTATRTSGLLHEARAMADARVRENPDYAAFAAIGDAFRDAGLAEDAAGAYMQALQLEPDHLAVRLALGDLSLELGRDRGALSAFEGVLARAPEERRALAPAYYLRSKLRGDEEARQALAALVEAHPDDARARELRDRLFPYVYALPRRVESIIDVARELWEGGGSGARLPGVALGALEAPSAIASFRAALEHLGATLSAGIEVDEIPVPDPRKPVVEVLFVPWRYGDDDQATEATPVPAPPAPDVSRALGQLAAREYALDDWWAAARDLDAVREGRLDDLLAAMVHPPPRPEGFTPWDWRFRVQVAAAYGVANLREGWPGVRRRALYALVVGPVDWTAEAAIAALTELALREEAARKDVMTLFGSLLEVPRSSIRLECIFRPLLACLPRLPGRTEKLEARLGEIRAEVDKLGLA